MTIRLKLQFDGRVFVPLEKTNVPAGSVFDGDLELTEDEGPLARLAKALEGLPSDPDAPTDMAAQHDHYLYGTPKRENP